jgi:hypothetical protein
MRGVGSVFHANLSEAIIGDSRPHLVVGLFLRVASKAWWEIAHESPKFNEGWKIVASYRHRRDVNLRLPARSAIHSLILVAFSPTVGDKHRLMMFLEIRNRQPESDHLFVWSVVLDGGEISAV